VNRLPMISDRKFASSLDDSPADGSPLTDHSHFPFTNDSLADDLYLPRADDELADASLAETRNLLQIIDFCAEKAYLFV